MEKYMVPVNLVPENPNPNPERRRKRRQPWQRSLIELNGRVEPKYRHDLSALLMNSYTELGSVKHEFPDEEESIADLTDVIFPIRKIGVSSLDFDTKGIYMASVTKSGCLTVHDFDTLYFQTTDACNKVYVFPRFLEDVKIAERVAYRKHAMLSFGCLVVGNRSSGSKHVMHVNLRQQLDAVKWNPSNQDEVACISMKTNEVLVFDISYVSSRPVEVLQTRRGLPIMGSGYPRGICDIAFTTVDDSRVIASDRRGVLNIWDRRRGVHPCMELKTDSHGAINSMQIDIENQIIFGASKYGIVHVWDIRGGRTSSSAFQRLNEVGYLPFTSLHLAPMLRKIEILRSQSEIFPKEIHSINLNPSCPYQLAFHLDDGWSGVLDLHDRKITHVHCPPPAWLDDSNMSASLPYTRKPSWLPTSSIYVVGSSSENGIHLLDFTPSISSPCHVDNEELQSHSDVKHHKKKNRFIPLSEAITACVTHPFNNTIIAGTKNASLLVVSERHESASEEDSTKVVAAVSSLEDHHCRLE